MYESTTSSVPVKFKGVRRHAAVIAERDGGWFCHYCLRPLVPVSAPGVPNRGFVVGGYSVYSVSDAFVDHVIPKRHGGTHSLDNLVLICNSCNSRKWIHPYEVALARIRTWVIENYGELQQVWHGQ